MELKSRKEISEVYQLSLTSVVYRIEKLKLVGKRGGYKGRTLHYNQPQVRKIVHFKNVPYGMLSAAAAVQVMIKNDWPHTEDQLKSKLYSGVVNGVKIHKMRNGKWAYYRESQIANLVCPNLPMQKMEWIPDGHLTRGQISSKYNIPLATLCRKLKGVLGVTKRGNDVVIYYSPKQIKTIIKTCVVPLGGVDINQAVSILINAIPYEKSTIKNMLYNGNVSFNKNGGSVRIKGEKVGQKVWFNKVKIMAIAQKGKGKYG